VLKFVFCRLAGGCSLEFIAVPFLAAVSHFMGSSSISALKNINQGFFLHMMAWLSLSISSSTLLTFFLNNCELKIKKLINL
jgi:hypothetical protein